MVKNYYYCTILFYVFGFSAFNIIPQVTLTSFELEARENSAEIEVENSVNNNDTLSFMDRQIPEDVIYDLAGRKTLITTDSATDKYLRFTILETSNKIPYIEDPYSQEKYLVYFSQYRKGVDIYPLIFSGKGAPMVYDWDEGGIKLIKFNKYNEVVLTSLNGKQDETNRLLVLESSDSD